MSCKKMSSKPTTETAQAAVRTQADAGDVEDGMGDAAPEKQLGAEHGQTVADVEGARGQHQDGEQHQAFQHVAVRPFGASGPARASRACFRGCRQASAIRPAVSPQASPPAPAPPSKPRTRADKRARVSCACAPPRIANRSWRRGKLMFRRLSSMLLCVAARAPLRLPSAADSSGKTRSARSA